MPFVTSRRPAYTEALADAILLALHTTPTVTLTTTPTVHLKTDNLIPGPNNTKADYTEADFVGYPAGGATVSLAGTSPVNLSSTVRGIHTDATFVAGAVTAPVTITGYWVDNGATTPSVTYAAENFAAPINLAIPGDFIALDVILAIDEVFQVQP